MGNSSGINCQMVQKSDAIILLQEAEKIDQYLTECDDDWMNFLARKHNMYAPNTIDTTDTVDYYNHLFKRLSHYLPKQLHNVGDINIVVLMPTADGGMPHTRPPNLICYPCQRGATQGSVRSIINESPTTFVHEVCHVHQRKFPTMWSTMFAAMGWMEWKGELPQKLDNNRRYNPDTIDSPLWIHGSWVPVPIFRDITQPVLSEVDIWFYHAVEGYRVKSVPEEMLIQGLPHSAYEHPREITAYVISEAEKYSGTDVYHIIRRFVDI
jgi:hypothetical protein